MKAKLIALLTTVIVLASASQSVVLAADGSKNDALPEWIPNHTPAANSVVLGDSNTTLKSGDMRVTLVDYDTNTPIILDEDSQIYISTSITINSPSGPMQTGPILDVNSNPSVFENIAEFFSADYFSFGLNEYSLPEGYSFPDNSSEAGYYNGTIIPSDHMTVTVYDNTSADVVIRLKYSPSGDVNNDGRFTVSDAVVLQKWLFADSSVDLRNWKAANFCNDDNLDIFDFCMMRKKLIEKKAITVLPDISLDPLDSRRFFIIGDNYNLYAGPGKDYTVIDTVLPSESLYEIGYNTGNDNWVYAEVNGRKGWVKVYCDDSNDLNCVFYGFELEKPVIYLYPQKETDVHVELELSESELATTYPKYQNGWDVIAFPDGNLLNKSDGTHHRYLFWDSTNCTTKLDFSEGFCIAGCDTEKFLKEKLQYMGLSEGETNEFIVYWLPRMEHNAFNLISYQGDNYTNSAKLNITPEPDSICRIFMAFIPLKNQVDIAP